MTELQVKTKKGSLKKFFAMFLAVCVCLTTVHVNGAFVQAAEEKGIKLNSSTLNLKEGEKANLEATVNVDTTVDATKDDATKDDASKGGAKAAGFTPTVTWTSSSASATITGTGNKVTVNAVKEGKATITATVKDVNEKPHEAKCEVTVSKKTPEVVEVTTVTVAPATLALDLAGTKTATLKATVAPANATVKTVTWASENSKVATVDAKGVVTAVATGTTKITATSNNKKVGFCTVTVKDSTKKDTPTTPAKPAVKVKSVKLSAKNIYLQFGKKITVGASITPKNATNKKIKWKSSNTKIATVSSKGVITAKKKAGKATITVTAKSNKKATAKVTVNVVKKATKVKSVSLKDAKVNVGETVALQPTYNPKKATISKVSWKSSNKKIATVSNGIVTGKKAGVATITVTADKKSAKCVVSVSKKNTTLTLKKTSGTVKVGKTIKIAKKKIGKGDSIKSYKSSNKKVATVTKKGVVKGVKKGNAVITVQTKKGAVATFKVTVKKK